MGTRSTPDPAAGAQQQTPAEPVADLTAEQQAAAQAAKAAADDFARRAAEAQLEHERREDERIKALSENELRNYEQAHGPRIEKEA